MVLATTEFSYLFLDIHPRNAFSAFGVQFISSLWLAQRIGVPLCCPERCEQNFRCDLLHFCPVQSFPSPSTHRGKHFSFPNPVLSDPKCGGFISVFVSASIRLPEYLCRGPRSQVWCRGSCSCQRTVGKLNSVSKELSKMDLSDSTLTTSSIRLLCF